MTENKENNLNPDLLPEYDELMELRETWEKHHEVLHEVGYYAGYTLYVLLKEKEPGRDRYKLIRYWYTLIGEKWCHSVDFEHKDAEETMKLLLEKVREP